LLPLRGKPVSKLITRASSINRALDQIGDKWCLLIIQEVFWGINSFNEMMNAMGVSKGVLSNRLQWLQSLDCLSKHADKNGGRRLRYHLTHKSVELYDSALMAIAWEREFFSAPELDTVVLTHLTCGKQFEPEMRCRNCGDEVQMNQVKYRPGPGATYDERDKKVRRRSSISVLDSPSDRNLYKNLIHLVGDRWTANLIALAFHGLTRFDEFHEELPVATNILADRLKFLVSEGIFRPSAYQQKPLRSEYKLTEKGKALYPWFLSLQQWGDKWCKAHGRGKPVSLSHKSCKKTLRGEVICSACGGKLRAHDVTFE
jgi:DNA-binding HxlR family transcriptional regulator